MTSKQRAYLRSMANTYDTIYQIGKGGISDMMVTQLDATLEARELIKLSCLETSPVKSREAADKIAEAVGCDVVQVIGSKFVLYKESKENKKIVLVKKGKKNA